MKPRPFIGKAGAFLDILLRNAGIRREDCWVTNVVKIRPPNNKLHRLKEYETNVKSWIPSLEREIRSLDNRRVIVPLGDTALSAVYPGANVTKHRGSYLWSDRFNCYVIPTYHPSYLLQYGYKMHTLSINDLLRAKQVSQHGHKPTPRREIIRPILSQTLDYIQRAARSEAFAWDLETFGDQISCFGIATSRHEGFCIPFKNGFKNYWSRDDEREIWEAIRKLMAGSPIKIAHNGFRFDNEFMYQAFGLQPAAPHFDTLLAHAVLHPDLKHSLDILTSTMTDIPYYKDDTKGDDEDVGKFDQSRVDEGYFETLWKYNCKDVMATFECYEHMVKDLKKLHLYDFFVGYEQPLRRGLFDMSNTGAITNLDLMNSLKVKYEAQIVTSEDIIKNSLGHELNVKSPKQMKTFLYEELGLPKQYVRDTKTGQSKVTANEEAIEKLIDKIENKSLPKKLLAELAGSSKQTALQEFIKLRGYYKIVGTYLNQENIDPDGRLRTSYGITKNGRLSSKGKMFGKGMNVQNIPKVGDNIRLLFEALPGWEVCEADLAQAEARIVAYVSGCQAMIDEFERPGGDVFRLIGSWIFNKKPEEITKYERQICKKTVHGSHYGMGPRVFAQHVGLPVPEATSIQQKYFLAFPEIRIWQEATRTQVCQTRILRTPMGRYRKFLGRLPYNETIGHDTYKDALANVPQSTVGDIENSGILKLLYRAMGTPVEAWFQVHDAIILHYPCGWKSTVAEWITEAFSKKIMISGKLCHIPVEVECGPSWGNLRPWFRHPAEGALK